MVPFLKALLDGEDDSMEKPNLRALVVEDFLPMRRVVCYELRNIPELQTIIEAGDGEEAVQRAREVLPDLVVMDIGLPKLNGIEAARQILEVSPHSKILFLSQETSIELIEEALATGAKGYVVKVQIGKSLLAAVQAVLRGEIAVTAE